MLKYFIIVILSIIMGCVIYVLMQSYFKKRKYKAKYDTIMTHLVGLDFPRMQLCNIYAGEEGMIFTAADKEVRLSRDKIYRLGVYSEHDFRRKAELEKVQIGSLEGMVRAIPRKNNNKDIYIMVLNYVDRSGDIAVAGFVNDVLVRAIDIFVKSVNEYYGLLTEVIEVDAGNQGASGGKEPKSESAAPDAGSNEKKPTLEKE